MRNNRVSLRRRLALGLAVLLAWAGLAGCAAEETPAPAPTEPPRTYHGTGRLTVGVTSGEEELALLREIGEKYRADWPGVEISVVAYPDGAALQAALEQGEADIAEVSDREQPALVRAGLLRDFYGELENWDEYATLTPAARRVVSSLGAEHAYLFPADFVQEFLFYRADWFAAYNADKQESSEMVYCRTWEQMITAAGRLGSRGGLAFAGAERLPDYFDDMLWSAITLGRVLDPAAAYYFPSEEPSTIFSEERTANGAAQFLQVMREAALPEAFGWSAEEAVKAFTEGRAGMLLADRGAIEEVAAALEPEAWALMEFPRGTTGLGIVAPNSFRGWGISANSENWELAYDFLMFLSNADNNTRFAARCGTLPIHTEAAELEPSLGESAVAVELQMMKRADWYQYALEPAMYRAYAGYREALRPQLLAAINGELSQEELLQDLDAYWMAAREEEGALWE